MLEELGSAQQTIDGLKQKDPVCNTKECVVSGKFSSNFRQYPFCFNVIILVPAAVLMEAMDPSIDPCQDFYQFACGGWLRKNSIPETSSRWGNFNILREQVTHLLKGIFENDPDLASHHSILF